jgi:predicted metal-dependent hydrolase
VVSYSLRRSSKAKLIWLNIKRQKGLSVTIPSCYNAQELPHYLKSNTGWILNNLAKYSQETPAQSRIPLVSTNTVPYLGKSLEVTQKRDSQGDTAVKLEKDRLIVCLSPTREKLSNLEVEGWLKEQAITIINNKAESFSKKMGLTFNRVRVRDQRSRWGSCSCRKNLNFNWRLVMAPEPVLDYVIIHELCHLKDMSHSRRFWKLVATHCPEWHDYRCWLDDHSLELNAAIQLSDYS